MRKDNAILPVEIVAQKIVMVRGHRVMLDRDLAALYGVETRALNQAVKRNRGRFPEDSCLISAGRRFRAYHKL